MTTAIVREKLLKAELAHAKQTAREALLKYGKHASFCASSKFKMSPCTCGLNDIIIGFSE